MLANVDKGKAYAITVARLPYEVHILIKNHQREMIWGFGSPGHHEDASS